MIESIWISVIACQFMNIYVHMYCTYVLTVSGKMSKAVSADFVKVKSELVTKPEANKSMCQVCLDIRING